VGVFVIANGRDVLTDGVFGMSDTVVTESIDEEIEVLDDLIEVVEDDLEEIEGELAEDRDRRENGRLVVITVDNRDDGLTVRLRAPQRKHVSALINRMYHRFRLEQQDGDRLTCDGTGESVYPFAGLTLHEYFAQGHCPEHKWTFRGDSGGA
jgi:Mg2+ and Co2+ transporter CorA